MLTREILDYVRQQLAAGMSKDELEKVLIATGWSVQDINDAFFAVGGARPASPSVQPLPQTQAVITENAFPAYHSAYPRTGDAQGASSAISTLSVVLGILAVIVLAGVGIIFINPAARSVVRSQAQSAEAIISAGIVPGK
ncbi:MAG: hypothetical protein WAN50_04420 [Minisyncoccia bacterium]